MDQPPEYMEVYIDFLPNQPKDEQGKKMLREMLSTRFEQKLPAAVERIFDLPPLMLKPEGDYLRLLVEARELYVEGRLCCDLWNRWRAACKRYISGLGLNSAIRYFSHPFRGCA